MSDPKRRESDPDQQSEVLTKPKVKRPPLYRVIMLNDDYTTQEFVVLVLRRFFHKPQTEAFECGSGYLYCRMHFCTGESISVLKPKRKLFNTDLVFFIAECISALENRFL